MALADAAVFAVVAYALDEASGNATDGSGHGYTATENGTIGSSTAPAGLGNSRDFEASDVTDYFSLADNADISIGDTDFTLWAWVNIESMSADRGIIGKWNEGDGNEYLLYLDATNRFYFFLNNGSNNNVQASTFGAPSTATWYLVVATYTASSDTMTIAVGAGGTMGSRDSTGSVSGGPRNGANPLTIGRFGGGAWWDGLIAECGVLKGYALSTAEESELYDSGNGIPYSSWAAAPAGQPFYWRDQRPYPTTASNAYVR